MSDTIPDEALVLAAWQNWAAHHPVSAAARCDPSDAEMKCAKAGARAAITKSAAEMKRRAVSQRREPPDKHRPGQCLTYLGRIFPVNPVQKGISHPNQDRSGGVQGRM